MSTTKNQDLPRHLCRRRATSDEPSTSDDDESPSCEHVLDCAHHATYLVLHIDWLPEISDLDTFSLPVCPAQEVEFNLKKFPANEGSNLI